MEPTTRNVSTKTDYERVLHTVTPLSKYLAMVLFIVMPFIGVYIGYTFAQAKLVQQVKVVTLKERPLPSVPEASAVTSASDVVDAYLTTDYRVVSVVTNPYYSEQSQYDTLIVVAPRGDNDYTCGGLYVPSDCYLFLESSYYNVVTPVYVGTWSGGLLQTETISFTGPTEITFNTANGDAGYGYKSTFTLDLMTGSSTRTAHEEFFGE